MELRFLRERLRRESRVTCAAFIGQLRPPLLEEVGLDGVDARTRPATLAALSGRRRSRPTSTAPAGRPAGAGAQAVVLRVVQEALQNVRKHAGARHVRLATRATDGLWTLEVRDDGRGFDPDAVGGPGRRTFGLQFMRERAELFGAQVRGAVADRRTGRWSVLADPGRGRRRQRTTEYAGPERRRGGPERRTRWTSGYRS